MEDVSNAESASLLNKGISGKDEPVERSSLPAGGTSRQNRTLGHLTGTQYESLQEERINVGVDGIGYQRNVTRIFEVVERGDNEALSNFLTSNTREIYCNDEKGHTALHYAVKSACRKVHSDDSFYQCIDLLMSCDPMKVNKPNNEGFTAIGLAVHHLHKTCIKHMLQHTSAKRLHLDCYPGDSECTVREIIMETCLDLQPLLPAPLQESLGSPNIDKKLLAALQHDEFTTFVSCLNKTNANIWYDEPYHSYLLEIACQMKNRTRFVEYLLDSGADPNIKNRVTGVPLIHATVRSGNFDVLQVLLEKEGIDTSLKDKENRTILHLLAGVRERKSGDKETIECCLKRLLESDFRKKHIDDRDSCGITAIYTTVETGFRDRAKLLLSKGADLRVFERGGCIFLSDSLSVVEEILDDCVQGNDKPLTSKDMLLTLNCMPFIAIVRHIAESKFHRDLLTHPVMTAFLSLKWQDIRLYFFLDMFFYLVFLLFLTSLIIGFEPYNTVNGGGADNNNAGPFNFNNSNITSGMNNSNITFPTTEFFLSVTMFIIFSRAIVHLSAFGWNYIRLPEKWLDILLIIATLIYAFSPVGSAELKRHSSAIALFLGWSELLLMLGRLPLLSVQLEMLRTVTLTFLRYMMGYVTLLIAFALSFYILFRGNSEQEGCEMFANPYDSILKTIFMFGGEFESSSLTYDTLPYTGHVIFLLFIVLVGIVLLNLLNGLAVSDAVELKRRAKTLSLAARAKLIYRFKRTDGFLNVGHFKKIPEKRKFIQKFFSRMVGIYDSPKAMYVIFPNRRNRTETANVRALLNIIRKKREPNEKDESTGIQEEWNLFKEKLSDLQFRQDELEKRLDSKFDETLRILNQILTDRHEV
jgi:ankyrin repeat protein